MALCSRCLFSAIINKTSQNGGYASQTIVRYLSVKPLDSKRVKKAKKSTASGYTKVHFKDFKGVTVKGGNGGDGAMRFTSLPRKEFAGPDGGNGGNGGHVIFKVDTSRKSLNHLTSHIRAEDGERGGKKCMDGKNSKHLEIELPVGTVVRDEDFEMIADLDGMSKMFIAARGGAGGKGNRFFVDSINRVPMIHEEGGKGQQRKLYLELRTMAHVGLVGFPNAGKSTLLRAISRARPRVASYPFTTLNPHIGMVEYEDLTQVAVADIPGLISGAHQNYGLGFAFLRHIERCVCLLYVLDLAQPAPWKQLSDLQYELEQYEEGLSQRPHAIVGNKIDKEISQRNLEELRERVDLPVFAVSAKCGDNIPDLQAHMRELYDRGEQLKHEQTEEDSVRKKVARKEQLRREVAQQEHMAEHLSNHFSGKG